MKSALLLALLVCCVPFTLGQKALTSYQEALPIAQVDEKITFTEPTWTYSISESVLCICAEIHGNNILFNNNGILTLVDSQNGTMLWEYENSIRKFISSNNTVLILDGKIFKTIDISTGSILNELVVDANPAATLAHQNASERFIHDFIYKDNILYINVGSIKAGGHLKAFDMRTAKVVWSKYDNEVHKFQKIQNDVLVSFSRQSIALASYYTFTSTRTGDSLWNVTKSRRMINQEIITVNDNSVDLFNLRGPLAAESIGGIYELDLHTGEHIGYLGATQQGCEFLTPTNWKSPSGQTPLSIVLDAKSYVQNDKYMYIKTKGFFDITQIYRQKRCNYPDFNPDTDKAIMLLSFDKDKQWIAGPVNNKFFFTDSNGLYHVSTTSIDNYEDRVITMPVLGHILTTSPENSLFFRSFNGVNTKATHLRIFESRFRC